MLQGRKPPQFIVFDSAEDEGPIMVRVDGIGATKPRSLKYPGTIIVHGDGDQVVVKQSPAEVIRMIREAVEGK